MLDMAPAAIGHCGIAGRHADDVLLRNGWMRMWGIVRDYVTSLYDRGRNDIEAERACGAACLYGDQDQKLSCMDRMLMKKRARPRLLAHQTRRGSYRTQAGEAGHLTSVIHGDRSPVAAYARLKSFFL